MAASATDPASRPSRRSNYDLCCNGEKVGEGQKKMVLSGLREFDQQKIDALVEAYTALKEGYISGGD